MVIKFVEELERKFDCSPSIPKMKSLVFVEYKDKTILYFKTEVVCALIY